MSDKSKPTAGKGPPQPMSAPQGTSECLIYTPDPETIVVRGWSIEEVCELALEAWKGVEEDREFWGATHLPYRFMLVGMCEDFERGGRRRKADQ